MASVSALTVLHTVSEHKDQPNSAVSKAAQGLDDVAPTQQHDLRFLTPWASERRKWEHTQTLLDTIWRELCPKVSWTPIGPDYTAVGPRHYPSLDH